MGSGGETVILEGLPGDAALVQSGGLLLMPHACPHSAAAVMDIPKVLVRGEVMPPLGEGPMAEQAPHSANSVRVGGFCSAGRGARVPAPTSPKHWAESLGECCAGLCGL